MCYFGSTGKRGSDPMDFFKLPTTNHTGPYRSCTKYIGPMLITIKTLPYIFFQNPRHKSKKNYGSLVRKYYTVYDNIFLCVTFLQNLIFVIYLYAHKSGDPLHAEAFYKSKLV